MIRFRYALSFILSVLLLTASALFVFTRISAGASAPKSAVPAPAEQTLSNAAELIAPSAADYARFASEDRAWREKHARELSADEWRARGDGRPTPRQRMQDRVYQATRAGSRAAAIRELESWVAANPRDKEALLSLARLLNEVGRRNDSLKRYRQVIALGERQ